MFFHNAKNKEKINNIYYKNTKKEQKMFHIKQMSLKYQILINATIKFEKGTSKQINDGDQNKLKYM